MAVYVRTENTRVVLEVDGHEVYLGPRNTNQLILLLRSASARADIVRAHNDNLTRGARSPWTADELRDLTHDDLEARVAADQAGSWKEG